MALILHADNGGGNNSTFTNHVVTSSGTDTYSAIAASMAIVVMYDASNVRRAAGEQAKILNYIMEHWTEMKPAIFGKELKEFLGHTPFQVLMGGLLGISVGLLGAWLWT